LAVSIGIFGALGGCRAAPERRTFHGAELVPPAGAPELGLRDASGAAFRVGDQRGKVLLVTFGYTHCPDFCPGTLAQYRATKDALGDDATRTRFVFVTIDPERDTPDVLGRYVAYFDPSFVGLSGEPAEVAAVTAAWGVTPEPDPAGSGMFTHATSIFVVDQHGRLRLAHPYGMSTEALVDDVRSLLAEGDEPAGLRVVDAWARAVPATSGVGAVFLTVVNDADEGDALVAADVDPAVAERVELHQSRTIDGVTSMGPVERIPVPGRGQTRLEPGGYHLMLQGLRHDLEAGQQVSLTLHFERAGRISVSAPVRMSAMPGPQTGPHDDSDGHQRNAEHE
jgi:protein SCO1/2